MSYDSTKPSMILKALGLTLDSGSPNQGFTAASPTGTKGDVIESHCPSTGAVLAAVQTVRADKDACVAARMLSLTTYSL